MKLLLDTQAFLWFVTDDARLSNAARIAIEDINNERSLSVVSVWEIAIKQSIGKLSLIEPLREFIANETAGNNIHLLSITLEHVVAVATLPMHHRDPFDRLLVVQTVMEGMSIVSSDEALDQYSVHRIW